MVYRGKVHNGMIVLEGADRLPEGTEVRIEPVLKNTPSQNKPRVGSPEAILPSAGIWAGEDMEIDRLLSELREMKRAEVEEQLNHPDLEL